MFLFANLIYFILVSLSGGFWFGCWMEGVVGRRVGKRVGRQMGKLLGGAWIIGETGVRVCKRGGLDQVGGLDAGICQ